MAPEIWVIVEQQGGRIETVSLELIGEAARLGKILNADSCAVTLGPQGFLTSQIQQELIRFGAKKIYQAEDKALTYFQSEVVTEIVTQAVEEKHPLAVLIGATPNGNDFAARVAFRIGSGLVSNCADIKTDAEGKLVFIKHIFTGQVQAVCAAAGQVQIATVKPDMIGLEEPASVPKRVAVEQLSFRLTPLCERVETIAFVPGDPATIDIREADVIVAGGKGVGGKEKWQLVASLATAVRGSIAGSRMAMDLGCIERERLVGQTGKTVSPKLYLALGISGAVQHTMGLKNVDTVVAVNQDREAPIMKQADLGIVGDVHEVVPLLVERLKAL
jgi:electron transfer flavoprotein alpha subunit